MISWVPIIDGPEAYKKVVGRIVSNQLIFRVLRQLEGSPVADRFWRPWLTTIDQNQVKNGVCVAYTALGVRGRENGKVPCT